MSDQLHTTIIHGDQPIARVDFLPAPGRWHRVLNELHDLGIIAGLSDSAYRVLGAFLRLNCGMTGSLKVETGLVFADVDRLLAITRRSRTYVYKGRSELLSHPRSLLAERDRDWYHVLPGWGWAGRADPPTSPHTGTTKSAYADEPSPIGDAACVPHRAARARPTNQPKTETENLAGPNPDPVARKGGLVGWPSLTSKGKEALAAGDVYALLMDLGVWEYMARPLGACLYITPERVLRTAAEVSVDRTAGNQALCLGKRLAQSFGVHVPPPPTKGRGFVPDGLGGIARMRAQMRGTRS